VLRHGEVVPGADIYEQRFEVAARQLDDSVATQADEVMVVILPADAVAELAWKMRERVDEAMLAEQRQGAVDGSETDPLAPGTQRGMNLLRGRVVLLG
jgi:hypothetical protein